MAPSAQVQRAKAAVKAMKLIGFNQDLAKKALKRLLKVYEENWEYIEAENYRVLADTILDDQESEDPMVNGTDVSANATESSHKRLRHSQGDPSRLAIVARAVASGDTNTRGKRAKIVEAQCSLNGQGTPTTAYELLKNGVNEETTPQYSHGCEEPSPSRDPIGHRVTRAKNLTQQLEKEKSVSLSLNERDKHQLSCKLGTLTRYEDKMLGPNKEGIQEVHYKIPDYYNVPHAVFPSYRSQPEIPANQFKAQSVDICFAKASTVLSHANMLAAPNSWNGVDIREVQAQKEMLSSLPRKQGRFSTDIASSNMGEVKLSLIFSSYSPNFQVPSLDSIFKAVENKCLKSYKILQPDFSLMNLMKEVCQCAVDVAADSSREEQEKVKKTTPNCSQPPSLRRMTRRSSGASMELIASEAPGTSMNRLESSQYVNGGNNEMQDNNTPESSCLNDSQSLAVIPLQENSVTVPRPPHDENDIAKGEERVRISLINEFTNEKFPPYFHYIPQNLVYQNAHVNFSLARIDDENCCPNCFGDCLSAPIPCACTREAGGEFVYTLDGLLKKEFLDECISMNRYPDKHHHVYCKDCPLEKSKNEPEACKGHLVRKFIKECWSKCGCSKHCGNRVVQRGISRNLQVFFSDDVKGWGLRTLEELPRGAFICEYVGEIVTNIELYDRTIQKTGGARHSYPVLLDADWASEAGLRDEEALCLDATFYGNIGRFVNHRCYDSNMVEVPVEWETPDHHYYHLAFFTTRKIEMLEELTWDYGIDFEDRSHPIKAFKCICGSKFCRGRRRSRARSQAGSSR